MFQMEQIGIYLATNYNIKLIKMKKIIFYPFFYIVFNLTFVTVNAQVYSNGTIAGNIPNENPFLDASSNFDNSLDPSGSGKGLVFPRTDLTTFTFNMGSISAGAFPTGLDGMIVYNIATGNTLAEVDGNNGMVTAVIPGYYYFNNPTGFDSVTAGVWTPLGSGGSGGGGTKDITTTAAPTDTKVNGKQVFAINGTFTASGTSTKITVTKPTGMTGYYKFSTYINGALFRGEIHSFDVNAVTNNVVLGNGFFSEVYPAGTYEYVLEYFTQ